MPQRVRLSRRRGWRKPNGVVVVARPSRWGNPFRIGGPDPLRPGVLLDRASAVARYRELVVETDAELRERARWELGGRDLACWCPIEDEHGARVPCHADVLLEVSNPTGAR